MTAPITGETLLEIALARHLDGERQKEHLRILTADTARMLRTMLGARWFAERRWQDLFQRRGVLMADTVTVREPHSHYGVEWSASVRFRLSPSRVVLLSARGTDGMTCSCMFAGTDAASHELEYMHRLGDNAPTPADALRAMATMLVDAGSLS